MPVLTLNSRSNSLKYQLYDWEQREVLGRGVVERVGIGDSLLVHEIPGRLFLRREVECHDHRTALALVLETLADPAYADGGEVTAVGHRVTHGGERFARSVIINGEVLAAIEEATHLAPLHNSSNIAGIHAAQALLPAVPHIALFDTAFHQTMPAHAYLYALPYEWYEQHGIRRYGFHGASHQFALKRAAAMLGKEPSECNLVTIHLTAGKGVSLCAIRGGVSVDTSMGLTPLEGVIMGTRCGDIDPGIPTFMMLEEQFSAHDMESILNQKSGRLGITGRYTERSELLSAAAKGDRRSAVALTLENYRLKKYIGAYMAVLGKVDAVVFAGDPSAMGGRGRADVLAGLEVFGIALDPLKNGEHGDVSGEAVVSLESAAVKVLLIPTDEELVFAEEVTCLLAGSG